MTEKRVDEKRRTLVLHVKVPEFYVSEADQEAADEFYDGDLGQIVTEEMMRPEVGITLVSLPGEKSMSNDFVVGSFNAFVVGAELGPASGEVR